MAKINRCPPFGYVVHNANGEKYIEIIEFDDTKVAPIIPSHIDDIPVKIIGKNAFRASHIYSIQLPETLVKIGDDAFNSCCILNEISFPDSVEYIGKNVCGLCSSLKNVRWSNKTLHIPPAAFYYCKKLENISGIDRITTIGTCAFSKTGFKSIKLPPSVKFIENQAFAYCEKLELVKTSSSVAIHNDAFLHSKKIKINCGKNEYVSKWATENNIPIFRTELNTFLDAVETESTINVNKSEEGEKC